MYFHDLDSIGLVLPATGMVRMFLLHDESCLVYSSKKMIEKESGMQIGDLVIAEHPDSTSRILARSYGVVLEITKTDTVKIALADGSVIKRHYSSVAVYIHPPADWEKRFQRQEDLFSPPKHHFFPSASRPIAGTGTQTPIPFRENGS